MAIVTIITLSDRTTQVQRGDVSTRTIVYQATTNSDMTPSTVLQDALAPKIRTRHPTHTSAVMVRISAEPISYRRWNLTAEYTYRYETTIHCRMSRRCGLREVPIWVESSPIAPGDYPWFPTATLTTPHVDIRGDPETKRVWHHSITVDVWIDTALAQRDLGDADYWQLLWLAALKKRNSTAFLGYDPGTVVFTGWSESLQEDPWITATLQFEADELYHLEQRVLPHVDGAIRLQDVSTVSGLPVHHAVGVYWYQPYRDTKIVYDETTLWNFTELLSPTPAYPALPP